MSTMFTVFPSIPLGNTHMDLLTVCLGFVIGIILLPDVELHLCC